MSQSPVVDLIINSLCLRQDPEWITSLPKIRKDRDFAERLLETGVDIYGFNRLVGHLDKIKEVDYRKINSLIIESHKVECTRKYDRVAARFIGFAKAQQLSKGGSGIDPDLFLSVLKIVSDPDFNPDIPSGLSYSSGDVIPAAHWANSIFTRLNNDDLGLAKSGSAICLINGNFIQVGLGALALLKANNFISHIAGSSLVILQKLSYPPDFSLAAGEREKKVFDKIRRIFTKSLRNISSANPPLQNPVSVRAFLNVLICTVQCFLDFKDELDRLLRRPSFNPLIYRTKGEPWSQDSFLSLSLTLKTTQLTLALANLSRCYLGLVNALVAENEAQVDIEKKMAVIQIPKALEAIHQRKCRSLSLSPGISSGSTSNGIEDYWTNGLDSTEQLIEFSEIVNDFSRVTYNFIPNDLLPVQKIDILSFSTGTDIPSERGLTGRLTTGGDF